MKRLRASFASFCRAESGATAIEYGLIAALIGAAATAGFTSYSDAFGVMAKNIANAVKNKGV